MKKIGIFPQYNEMEHRLYNRLCIDYVKRVEEAGAFAVIIPAFSVHLDTYLDECDAFIFSG
jgi:gamma-glutamyl-gamma-aminobutyrate hydrolase PuuD